MSQHQRIRITCSRWCHDMETLVQKFARWQRTEFVIYGFIPQMSVRRRSRFLSVWTNVGKHPNWCDTHWDSYNSTVMYLPMRNRVSHRVSVSRFYQIMWMCLATRCTRPKPSQYLTLTQWQTVCWSQIGHIDLLRPVAFHLNRTILISVVYLGSLRLEVLKYIANQATRKI